MTTRIFSCVGIALLAFPLALFAAQEVHAPEARSDNMLPLAQALQIALKDNPGLAKAGAQAQALAELPAQVGTLPDPVLSLNELNLPTDTYSQSQEAMTQMQVGIGLTLPFPGKLDMREQAAGFNAQAAAYGVDETRLVLTRNVNTIWWNLVFLDRAIAIVQHNQDLLREFIRIAEAKYKTGQGMQSDVLLAQVELSKLLETGISLQASRRGQAAALNALLGRSAASPVQLPQQAEENLPAEPDFGALHELALQTRPLLSAQRSQVEAARTQVALARKDYYPDFKLGAAYGFRKGYNPDGSRRADVASFTFSMNLPIFSGSKQDHALSQRTVEMQREEYGLQDRIAQTDSEIEQALADYRAGREQASLFKTGIIPQASQTAAAMLAAYQVDKVDFLNLIRAQVTLFNYETQYWKVLSASWQAWARLEAAVGRPLAQDATHMQKEQSNE
jgi:outer membrane protein, heavy metal efflux system